MLNPELYHKSVDILVQAYFNNTLRSWDCSACAVGNLVAANMGYTSLMGRFVDEDYVERLPSWNQVHCVSWVDMYMGEIKQKFDYKYYRQTAKAEIDSTGYTPEQTATIELAFENGIHKCKGTEDEKMFSGLMSVVAALDEIHQNTDHAVTVQSKQKFIKA